MIEGAQGGTEDRNARPTIVDVARAAGVSKSTVSLVISGSGLVAESTRERVSGAMAIGIEEACQGGAFIPFLANVAENPVRQLQVIRSMR